MRKVKINCRRRVVRACVKLINYCPSRARAYAKLINYCSDSVRTYVQFSFIIFTNPRVFANLIRKVAVPDQ